MCFDVRRPVGMARRVVEEHVPTPAPRACLGPNSTGRASLIIASPPAAISIMSGPRGSSENVAVHVRAASSGHATDTVVLVAVTETDPGRTSLVSMGTPCASQVGGSKTNAMRMNRRTITGVSLRLAPSTPKRFRVGSFIRDTRTVCDGVVEVRVSEANRRGPNRGTRQEPR